MPRVLILLALTALTALAACHRDSAPGGATTAESQALDDAAEMLEHKRLPDSALRPPSSDFGAAEQAGPAAAPSVPPK